MSKRSSSSMSMVATKYKNKVIPCSTPEQAESPSRDSDSICDSDAASPVPFLCTQDGAEGETDVVWNFYTPKSDHTVNSRLKNSTPLSRKAKKTSKNKLIERQVPKRRQIKSSQIKTEFFQELFELNQNLHELIAKKSQNNSTPKNKIKCSNNDDVLNESPESPRDSPKSGLKTNSRCLRRNVLSSKFCKSEPDNALESDDSMNECLLQASQAVENILESEPTAPKRVRYESKSIENKRYSSDFSHRIDDDAMDAILNCIKIQSPAISKVKNIESPHLNNDSYDSLFGNLNDSILDQLTQMPIKNGLPNKKVSISKDESDWKIQELVVHDGSPSSNVLTRHNSMPESPSFNDLNKPSTSGTAFGRYNSMPYNNSVKYTEAGDSPIKCSSDEIERKRRQAKEKLFAKRMLPFTCTQKSSQPIQFQLTQQPVQKKAQFQPKVATNAIKKISNVKGNENDLSESDKLKSLIEKKRQEALMKLRRRQPPSK